jgi:hypothetical protein
VGAVKQDLIEQQEQEDSEVVADCQGCGEGVSSAQLNTMPYHKGEPVFIFCEECMQEENWTK